MNNKIRLRLPQVTLCAVTSTNVRATSWALERSLEHIDFGTCKLLTDAKVLPSHQSIEVVPIEPLISSAAYSDFMLSRLVDFVDTPYCLVAQWDGHVVNAEHWRPEFLEYDYIGASWPQFGDGHDVGNGGFSLRSRRLMKLCRDPAFVPCHPEDVAIARTNRIWLENQGVRFAPRELADLFAAERFGDPKAAFGYHGVWNMPRAIGLDNYWQAYLSLDELGTIRHDFGTLLRAVGGGRGGVRRMARMLADRMSIQMHRSRTEQK